MSRRWKLLDALASAPRDLERMLRPLSPAAALRRPGPGDWCAADIVAHLGYVEALFLERFQRIVAEDVPAVPYIHPDASAHDLGLPLTELLGQCVERRAATLAFLGKLDQAAWARRLVRESDATPSTLRDQVQNLVDHDSAHLAQLAQLRSRLEQG